MSNIKTFDEIQIKPKLSWMNYFLLSQSNENRMNRFKKDDELIEVPNNTLLKVYHETNYKRKVNFSDIRIDKENKIFEYNNNKFIYPHGTNAFLYDYFYDELPSNNLAIPLIIDWQKKVFKYRKDGEWKDFDKGTYIFSSDKLKTFDELENMITSKERKLSDYFIYRDKIDSFYNVFIDSKQKLECSLFDLYITMLSNNENLLWQSDNLKIDIDKIISSYPPYINMPLTYIQNKYYDKIDNFNLEDRFNL